MKRIPISIIHFIGFGVVTAVSVAVFARTAVVGAAGLHAKVLALARFHHTADISCEVGSKRAVYGNEQDTVKLLCTKEICTFSVYHSTPLSLAKTFAAIDNAGVTRIDVDTMFYDTDRKIISYTTKSVDTSSRIVVNFEGELLQSIDETPGSSRALDYLGYQPETGMLVYYDRTSGYHYFYRTDAIYFARRLCR